MSSSNAREKTMSLSLRSAAELLHGAGLLREIITPSTWTMDPDDVPGCDDPLTDRKSVV